MKNNIRLQKHLLAGVAALIALITYMLTVAPTVSFWDCGEFIACANILGIPHPPGTPFFMFFARVIIVALPFVEEIAKRVNYISVFTSAITVYVVFLFIWELLSRFLRKDPREKGETLSGKAKFMVAVGGFCGSLLLTFSDTFWFNAVEAEVYGFAMLIVVLVSYLALIWADHQGTGKGERILILICYLAFLGVGVHLYTLLTIPAVFLFLLIADESKMKEKLFGAVKFALLFGAAAGLWYVIDLVLKSQGIANLPLALFPLFGLLVFYKVDPKGQNIANWPMWFSGVILYSAVYSISSFPEWAFLLFLGLFGLRFLVSENLRPDLRISQWFAVVALVGFSTHAYIPIRSALNPRIDENNPEIPIRFDGKIDLVRFWSDENWRPFNDFLERKQYGSESMLSRAFYRRGYFSHQALTFPHMGYGGYQIAQYLPFPVGFVQYYQPGMYQVDPDENRPWEGFGISIPTQMMSMGDKLIPQLFWFLLFNLTILYICYLLYRNRKSVGIFVLALYLICSAGLLLYINFADGMRLEERDRAQWMSSLERERGMLSQQGVQLPGIPDPNQLVRIRHELSKPGANRSELESHPDWQAWRRIQAAYSSAGYRAPEIPNPVHLEVRERDYFYSPAFIFMSLIFGVGVGLLLISLVRKGREALVIPVGVLFVLICGVVPAVSNWREHDRSSHFVPWDYAYNLIMSCLPNSVLFTNGDNDTFPLWFIQEVEHIRQDVRVVNLSLGNTDWYIKQMLEIEPTLNLSYDHKSIDERLVFSETNQRHPEHLVDTWVRRAESAMPVLQRRQEILVAQADSAQAAGLEVDAQTKQNLHRVRELIQLHTALIEWGGRRKGGFMKTQDRLVLDIVQHNPDRPIHFATTVSSPNMVGLEKYMVMEGMVYTLQKGILENQEDRQNVERTRYLVDSVYKFRGLGDGSYINEETTRLLFSYNTIYLRLALEARTVIMQNLRGEDERQMAVRDSALHAGLQYMDKAKYKFPEEWRNYAVSAELLELVGKLDSAKVVLEKGISNAHGRGKDDLLRRSEALKVRQPAALPQGGLPQGE